MAIKKNYLIEKRNDLNGLAATRMTLQELRFLSIYLSRINARDPKTRVVRFLLDDFRRIMELDSRIRLQYIQQVTNRLLCKVVNVPTGPNDGYKGFHLFSRCRVDMDADGCWYIEINAHDDALPLMFEFKERYFTYQLWNTLRLKSRNQLRMYEILKQYEKVGERIIKIPHLKELLGMTGSEYPRYGDFKAYVLETCRVALQENTDIRYDYEPSGKRGRGGKVSALKFTIKKNDQYMDPLSLENFITECSTVTAPAELDWSGPEPDGGEADPYGPDPYDSEPEETGTYFDLETYPLMSDACDNEFNKLEIQVLYNLVLETVPCWAGKSYEPNMHRYLKSKYDQMKLQASKNEIRSRFGYLKKIIEADLNQAD